MTGLFLSQLNETFSIGLKYRNTGILQDDTWLSSGVLEDRVVPESPEVDANLFVNVFRTYAESFIQL